MILFAAAPIWAAGPKYDYGDPKLDDELNSIYKEIKFPNFVNARGSTMTVTYLNVSSITLNGAALSGSGAAGQVQGTATNDNAAAGKVGEYISSIGGFSNAPTSNQYGDLTSISLTAGDWDVSIQGKWASSGATWSYGEFFIGLVSGNSASGDASGDNQWAMFFANTALTIQDLVGVVSDYRMSLASTTTVYLKYSAIYTAGTPIAKGRITARRVR